jgi:hypothetical protein
MIHGKDGSVGCLAMGDPAIEELFVLADRVGIANVEVVLRRARIPSPWRVRRLGWQTSTRG